MSFYPHVDTRTLAGLTSIKQMMEIEPGYFDSAECTYDDDQKSQLKELLGPRIVEIEKIVEVERIVEKKVEVAAAAAEGGGKRGPKSSSGSKNAEIIAKELQAITNDLRQLKLNSKALMPADKVQIIKTQAALVEKMIVMEERTTNIKKVSMFMSVVMGLLDDIMDDEQRQMFMKRLAPFAQEE